MNRKSNNICIVLLEYAPGGLGELQIQQNALYCWNMRREAAMNCEFSSVHIILLEHVLRVVCREAAMKSEFSNGLLNKTRPDPERGSSMNLWPSVENHNVERR